MKTLALIVLIACLVGFDAWKIASYLDAQETEQEMAFIPDVEGTGAVLFEFDEGIVDALPGTADRTDTHHALRFVYDVPGVTPRQLPVASDVAMRDSTPVVGIEANGETFAFSLPTMYEPIHHIVNVFAGADAISVTYCPLVDCVRVFRRRGDRPTPLRLGGLNERSELVLLLDGTRYDQSSLQLPLEDFPFQRLTFGQWKRQHPGTKVFGDDAIRLMLRERSTSETL